MKRSNRFDTLQQRLDGGLLGDPLAEREPEDNQRWSIIGQSPRRMEIGLNQLDPRIGNSALGNGTEELTPEQIAHFKQAVGGNQQGFGRLGSVNVVSDQEVAEPGMDRAFVGWQVEGEDVSPLSSNSQNCPE